MKSSLIFLVLFLGFCFGARCSTNITLVVGDAPRTNADLTISTGQVARVVYFTGNGRKYAAKLNINVGGEQINLPTSTTNYLEDIKLPVTIAGPAEFSLWPNYDAVAHSWGKAFCTIEVSGPNQSPVPSTAVVIPADSGGPVNIILESSADLINWYPSLPGTYGANYTNRFFRVRAELASP